MKVLNVNELVGSDRHVICPKGGFQSLRPILACDGMGFSVHKTLIPVGSTQTWHYANHLEACYCVAGRGELVNMETWEKHFIEPDVIYVLDKHDKHQFTALEPVVLISIFNPPVTGVEVHDANGSYPVEDSNVGL